MRQIVNISLKSGVARGCGWQHIGAFINLGAFYLFGIPIAATLAFWLRLRGRGLWIGLQAGALLQTILLGVVTSCTNWEKQVYDNDILPSLPTNFTTPRYKMTNQFCWIMQNSFICLFLGNQIKQGIKIYRVYSFTVFENCFFILKNKENKKNTIFTFVFQFFFKNTKNTKFK